MAESFRIGSAIVRDIARSTWNKSSEVAAISYVLARVTMGMVPDKALLAGLVHNIGAIPILRYVADYPELSKNRDLIHDLIRRLGQKIGSLVLKQWSFDQELVGIPTQLSNHDYAPERDIDYVDLVIVANLHSQFGKEDEETQRLVDMMNIRLSSRIHNMHVQQGYDFIRGMIII